MSSAVCNNYEGVIFFQINKAVKYWHSLKNLDVLSSLYQRTRKNMADCLLVI